MPVSRRKRLNASERLDGQTQAEADYASGARIIPPQLHEMSETSRQSISGGFTDAMSGWRSREQGMLDKGLKSALPQEVINRLDDRVVDIPTASRNLVNVWDRMMVSDNKPAPAWYFGHNRRLTRAATDVGLPADRVIDAAATMSPQNDPDNEYRAAAAMADAVANKRQVRFRGQRRSLVSMTPDDVQEASDASNRSQVQVAKGFDFGGFRHAGTNRRLGWETMKGTRSGPAEMETAKVPIYAMMTRMSKADSPLHAEYEARFGDQLDAQRVNQARSRDSQAGRTGSETLHGVMDRVDLYGLMGRGSDGDDSDPIHNHPVLGKRGLAVPDTWMAAMLSGQDMRDMPDSSSPAKLAASQTKSTSANSPNTTFSTPAEVAGGKPLTPNAAWGMAAVHAIQGAATMAREPGSQTNIPPVMMQEMTWVYGRNEVAESARQIMQQGNRGALAARVKKLTSGGLEGLKEFRGASGSRQPQALETPGSFFRGYDNPLDTDRVSVLPNPQSAPSVRTAGPNPALADFHANAAGPAPSELDKRRAIKEAMKNRASEA